MPKKPLSDELMLRGTENAIRALRRKRRGPVWLIPSLEKRRDDLRKKLGVKSGGGETRSLIPRAARGFARPLLVVLLALALILGVAFLPSLSLHRTTHADTFAVQQAFFNAVFSSNGTLIKSVTPSANGSVRIYSVAGYCSGAGTGGQMVIQTFSSGILGAGLWNSGPFDIGQALSSYYWPTPVQGPPGVPLAIQIANCNGGGASNVTLEFQYSVN